MGWVESSKFLCDFLETLTDVDTTMVDTDLPVLSYGAIFDLLSTGMGPPHTWRILTHIDCYMDDVISAVQVGPEQQHRVFDITVHAINWLSPHFQGKPKTQ